MSATPARDEAATAVVTGASSGIGAEIARALARRRWRVVLAARREPKLRAVAADCEQLGGSAVVRPTDVSQRAEVEDLVDRTFGDFGRCDVLVNNAGFGQSGRVHELGDGQMRSIFEVNFYGLWWACRTAAPRMIDQGWGHIFNVSSVIGKRGTPFNGAYCATKFAVSGLTESMRVELAPRGVRVTLVCPGLTDTEFFEKVEGGSSTAKSSYARLRTMQSPRKVARRMVRTIGKSTPELVFTPGGKFLVKLAALSPRLTDWLMGFYRDSLEKDRSL